jgi:flagellar biosynthesis protein FliR
MHDNILIPVGDLLTFLFVLTRIAGAFVFIPIPGSHGVANPARILMCMGISVAVYPYAPHMSSGDMDILRLGGIIFQEAAFGIATGLLVSIAVEAFQFGAQMVSLQAGLSFATTFDPNTQAESTVLITIAQLLAGCLFFAFGFDHRLLAALSQSIAAFPPGMFTMNIGMAEKVGLMLSGIFSTGMLAMMPILAFLLLLDIVLAMLGRLHSQLQLLTLAFPMKLLCITALFAWMAVLFPKIYEKAALSDATGVLSAILKH